VTARKFSIVYQMPKRSTSFNQRGLNIAEHNKMEQAGTPLSATYIVNQEKSRNRLRVLESDTKKTRRTANMIIETLLR